MQIAIVVFNDLTLDETKIKHTKEGMNSKYVDERWNINWSNGSTKTKAQKNYK